jgi:hypothetical protein
LPAEGDLSALLDEAVREGQVRIVRRDGRAFVIRAEPLSASPLDVPPVDLRLTTAEILSFIREGRRERDD